MTRTASETSNAVVAAVLGGGQLARLLVQAGRQAGVRAIPLVGAPDEPAAQVASEVLVGSLTEETALRGLLASVPLAVFENEFVDTERLRSAAQGLEVRFVPSLEVIHRLQDKLRQKDLLAALGIPTAAWERMPEGTRGNVERELAWARGVSAKWSEGAVLKWAQGGYDGYGTWIPSSSRSDPAEFLARARARGTEVFAEQKIRFVRELALVACRSVTGEFRSYPLVVSTQERGVCREVLGPARSWGVRAGVERAAQAWARRIAEELELVGVFAMEFFESGEGELQVNELAPRVHNSGHYSLDVAGMTSQFENHWRAALGLPLGATEAAGKYFAMRNLLGPRDLERAIARPPRAPSLDPALRLHWYGKRESRPGRKLGHLNGEALDTSRLEALLKSMAEAEARWDEEMHDGQRAP